MRRDDFVIGFLLGLLIGTLWGVGIAKAAPFTPELEADYAYAEQWWGAAPSGCSTVTREVLPDAVMPGRSGQATQPIPGAASVPCILDIAEGALAVPCFRREVVLHEYGHLLGYSHSADPASVMYPEVSGHLCGEEARVYYATAEATRLRRMIARTNARCRVKPTLRQRTSCRQTEREYRQLLAAALHRVQEPQS